MAASVSGPLHVPMNPVRFITASGRFDGHDASINVMRRILQSQGAEVVHLGHNRSVKEVVDAAVEEDVQGVVVSSYQGGHVEYFEYLVESLGAAGARGVRVYGGGGGVIVAAEIARLREHGVSVFAPQDGQRLGLPQMVNVLIRECDIDLWRREPVDAGAVLTGDRVAVARAVTGAELGALPMAMLEQLRAAARSRTVPVLGVTGTGGSGKSSLTDELVRRLRVDQQDKLRVAVVAVDPTRRRGGGALLCGRIRMASLDGATVYFRSLATRGGRELPESLPTVIDVLKAAGFDLVIVETPGIGQGDAAIVPLADVSLYVMTPEYGAASQLEKIDMLGFADAVAINKFERRGAEGALREVARQLVRNREAFASRPADMPVFGTSAATFNDDGVTALYHHLKALLAGAGLAAGEGLLPTVPVKAATRIRALLPSKRQRYLSEVIESVRSYHRETVRLADRARSMQRLESVAGELPSPQLARAARAARERIVVERAEVHGRQIGGRLGLGYALHALGGLAYRQDHNAVAYAQILDRALSVLGDEPRATDLLLLLGNAASSLDDLGRPVEAQDALGRAVMLADWGQAGVPPRLAALRVSVAAGCFDRGRWDEALAELLAAEDLVLATHNRLLVRGVRALIAIHRDDRAAAEIQLHGVEDLRRTRGELGLFVDDLVGAWALAAERDGQPAMALTRLLSILDADGNGQFSGLTVGSWKWLIEVVRLAQAVGDPATAAAAARACVRDADRQARPATTAAAQHCQGLLARDPVQVRGAADTFQRIGYVLLEAQALENSAVLYAERGDATAARADYLRAIDIYTELGASWDIIRADARLRPHDIHRGRRGPRRRPTAGWESLTRTEQKIAQLVAAGQSNPNIAAQLLVSRRTVETHVSHILTKLGADSRIDIIRGYASATKVW